MAELKAFIAMRGILTPLVVETNGKDLFIVSGHRRWRAAKELGLKQVPCLLLDHPAQPGHLLAANQQERLEFYEEAMVAWRVTHELYSLAFDPGMTLEAWGQIVRCGRSAKGQGAPAADWVLHNYHFLQQELPRSFAAYGFTLAKMAGFLATYEGLRYLRRDQHPLKFYLFSFQWGLPYWPSSGISYK